MPRHMVCQWRRREARTWTQYDTWIFVPFWSSSSAAVPGPVNCLIGNLICGFRANPDAKHPAGTYEAFSGWACY